MNPKPVILAGSLGSRLSEETVLRPKPMVEIGGMPMIWHIMKIYNHYGFSDFIVYLGYKSYVIKEFFANYFLHSSDVTLHLAKNRLEVYRKATEPWRVTLIDTGETSQTGGRIKRILPYVENEPFFALTYGDDLADIDLRMQIEFHRAHGRDATVTGVRPAARFGTMRLDDDRVIAFAEKPASEAGWINGGFFLLAPRVGATIEGNDTVWEHEPLDRLARSDQLRAYVHRGFWHPMDTLGERNSLEELWASGKAPWKVW